MKSRTPHPKVPHRSRITTIGAALVLALLAVGAYLPATGAGFIWDDDDYVSNNAALRDGPGLARIWFDLGATPQYYPLTFTTFWIEFRLWKLNTTGYHVSNIVLHACSTILLWILLRSLAIPGAFFLVALWSLHPLQVESVAWISERKNVLSGFFYFAALLAWFRFDGVISGSETEMPRRRGWYALSLFLFICALFSKTVTTSLPVVILLIVWWKRPPVGKRSLIPTIPFFLAGGAISSITIWMEKFHVSAKGVDWQYSFVERLLIAGRAFWFYLAKLAAPVNLSFIYTKWEIDPAALWQYIFPAAAAALLLTLWFYRRRIGRGPLAAMLFFTVTIAPALGFIDVYPMRYSFVADHFQYLAGIGPILLAGTFIRQAARRIRHPDLLLVLAAILFSILTWERSRTYVDLETLWRDTIDRNPQCWMAYNNLGAILQKKGEMESARQCYERSLKIEPKHARPHSNIGTILLEQDRVDEAVVRFREAIRLNPLYVDARFNLGKAFEVGGFTDSAVTRYRSTLDLRPGHIPARYNLASTLARSGATGEAIDLFNEVLRTEPEHLQARVNLGNTLAMEKRFNEAAEQYRQVLRLKPDHALAHRNLGNVLSETGDRAAAAEHYRRAARLRPDWTDLEKRAADLSAPKSGE